MTPKRGYGKLVPLAVKQTLSAAARMGLPGHAARRLVAILMQASGAAGMVGGQLLDLEGEGKGLALGDLERVHRAKTGALISAAFTLGGIAAGGAEERVASLTRAGDCLGLAFQIADDVLDATGTSEELGKTAGRDAQLAKSTYVSVMGVDAARAEAERLARQAVRHLEEAGVPSGALGALAGYIVTRNS